ncbi:SOUL heme-binding protein [Roseibium alexandrii DFL-11]|uniref:SOUL heme-binding protein n=1 Tax=Roseibium alexandrii (strain DSM 17067 / NCIMB 14079 / DFL-11) TaxID=244592 RepID=A0A5E8H5G3_ROSAD|nr:SOUL heme-binding protein [Roseibium alexandrii DFL-11]
MMHTPQSFLRRKPGWLGVTGPAVVALLAILSSAAAALEQPSYKVLSSDGPIEIRQYKDMAAAEVTVAGDRSAATRKAFRILFRYISGDNQGSNKIEMTAPVSQQAAPAEIAMTAPVTQQPVGNGEWRVAFYLPSEYTVRTAPRPDDNRIRIVNVKGKKVAAIRFSGMWTDRNFNRHLQTLEQHLSKNGLKVAGAPIFAYFNAPFTLPPFRRNEVQIPLSR